MKIKSLLLIGLSLLGLVFTSPLHAEDLSATKAVEQVEHYINNLKTLKASFRQVGIGSAEMQFGNFYLNRPRQFNFHYTEPTEFKLISTGSQLFYYDKNSEQITQLPLGSGLSKLLIQDEFKLSNSNFQIAHVNSGEDFIDIAVAPRKGSQESDDLPLRYIVLSFTRSPLKLKQLVTADTLGKETYMDFLEVSENTPLEKSLFKAPVAFGE